MKDVVETFLYRGLCRKITRTTAHSVPSLSACRFIIVIGLNVCLIVNCTRYLLVSLGAMEVRQDGMMENSSPKLPAAIQLRRMKQHDRYEKGQLIE